LGIAERGLHFTHDRHILAGFSDAFSITITASMKRSTQFKALGINANFLAIEKNISSFEHSRIVVLPAPYEHTVSYGGGTGRGPDGIITASHYVEFYDDELNRELCMDVGIATLPPIRFGKTIHGRAMEMLRVTVSELLAREKFVVTLGGEHTISQAAIKAHLGRYPDLSVIQFDAHSDLRDSYQGSPYSHASVMARVCEFVNPHNVVQVGIRAQCIEEAEFIRANGVNTFYAHYIRSAAGKNWQDEILQKLSGNVYVTFDVDGFDPAIMPSTGTPEPNGLFWAETMQLLRRIGEEKRIVGCDIVELAPVKGVTHPDLTAAKLTYKLMNYAFINQTT
jgi:agmatinase